MTHVTSENRKFPRWLQGLARVVLVAVTALLALEIGLRLGLGDVFPPRFFEPHPQFGHFHVPGRSGWQRTAEYHSFISINSKGLRDVERPYAKPDGTFRILMLGDSFVEGLQVDQHQTLPAQLEALLNRHTRTPVEVINAGVSRYGTDNAVLFLEHEGMRYELDLVIYAFYPNDVTDNIDNDLFRLIHGELARQPTSITLAERMRLILYDYSYFYRFVLGLSARWNRAVDRTLIETEWGKVLPIYRAALQPREQHAWELTARLLDRMSATANKNRARLVIVALPEDFQSEDRLWEQVEQSEEVLLRDAPNRALAEAVPDGVPCYDLLPGFRAAAQQQALYYPLDHHFNPTGQALAAALIAEFLVNEGLVPTASVSDASCCRAILIR